MLKSRRHFSAGQGPLSPGWLFADLLLVLTILFLATSVVTRKKPVPVVIAPTFTPTVMATQVGPPPTATALPRLSNQAQTYSLTLDSTGVLNGNAGAIADTKKQILATLPANKHAGLIIVYVGYSNSSDLGEARNIGEKLNGLLMELESDPTNHVLADTAIHDPLGLAGDGPFSHVVLEVYYFL